MATPPRPPTRRTRRTAEQVFLDKLSKLTHGEQTLILNATLREELGWRDEKYNAVRIQLRHDQLINMGQGHGGKVGLAKLPNRKALKLFVSYNHLDAKYKDDLVKHIDPLRRLKLIDTWFDGKIQAGKNIDDEIRAELASSDIILLLVSIDYLNSYYCVEIEMEEAMARHETGKSQVIPVILSSCMWQHMPFSKLKSLPSDAKAVAHG
jgi:TIR domain